MERTNRKKPNTRDFSRSQQVLGTKLSLCKPLELLDSHDPPSDGVSRATQLARRVEGRNGTFSGKDRSRPPAVSPAQPARATSHTHAQIGHRGALRRIGKSLAARRFLCHRSASEQRHFAGPAAGDAPKKLPACPWLIGCARVTLCASRLLLRQAPSRASASSSISTKCHAPSARNGPWARVCVARCFLGGTLAFRKSPDRPAPG